MDFQNSVEKSGHDIAIIVHLIMGELTQEIIDEITLDQWLLVFEANKLSEFVANWSMKKLKETINQTLYIAKSLDNPHYTGIIEKTLLYRLKENLRRIKGFLDYLLKSMGGDTAKYLAMQKMKELALTSKQASKVIYSMTTGYSPYMVRTMRAAISAGICLEDMLTPFMVGSYSKI